LLASARAALKPSPRPEIDAAAVLGVAVEAALGAERIETTLLSLPVDRPLGGAT
jgi:hypothetical protein